MSEPRKTVGFLRKISDQMEDFICSFDEDSLAPPSDLATSVSDSEDEIAIGPGIEPLPG